MMKLIVREMMVLLKVKVMTIKVMVDKMVVMK